MSERNTDYQHDGVIPMDDPFWQTRERDLTDEDFARMTMTAAEYDALLGDADKQDRFADAGMHDASPEDQEAWLVENGYAQPGDVLGYLPGELYYEEGADTFSDPIWEQAVEQAERGNYLEPLS